MSNFPRKNFKGLVEDAVKDLAPLLMSLNSLILWMERLEKFSEKNPLNRQHALKVRRILSGKQNIVDFYEKIGGIAPAYTDVPIPTVNDGLLTFATIIFQIAKISAHVIIMSGQLFFLIQKIPGTLLMIRDISTIIYKSFTRS
jgi:VanZ family protein